MTPVSIPSSPTTRLLQFFAEKNITLDPGETTDVKLDVFAKRCYCQYRFEIEMIRANSITTVEANGILGRPLMISGPADAYSDYWYDGRLACRKTGVFRADSSREVDCSANAP